MIDLGVPGMVDRIQWKTSYREMRHADRVARFVNW